MFSYHGGSYILANICNILIFMLDLKAFELFSNNADPQFVDKVETRVFYHFVAKPTMNTKHLLAYLVNKKLANCRIKCYSNYILVHSSRQKSIAFIYDDSQLTAGSTAANRQQPTPKS